MFGQHLSQILVVGRRAADEDEGVVARSREAKSMKHFHINSPSQTGPLCVFGGVVCGETVESSKSIWRLILKLFDVVSAEDVVFGLVGEDQSHVHGVP